MCLQIRVNERFIAHLFLCMSILAIKGPMKTARRHVNIAHTRYGREQDDLMFIAHVKAAYVALTGDHVSYTGLCRDLAIPTEDKEWKREIRA